MRSSPPGTRRARSLCGSARLCLCVLFVVSCAPGRQEQEERDSPRDRSDGSGAPQTEAEALTAEGVRFLKAGRAGEAERCLRAALQEDPKYAPAALHLSQVHLDRWEFPAARDALEYARRVSPDVRSEVEDRLSRLVRQAFTAADEALKAFDGARAKAILEFVRDDVGGAYRDEAQKRLLERIPFIEASQNLQAAKKDLARRDRPEAVKRLEAVAMALPNTAYAREANRLLESLGRRMVLQTTASGYEIPPYWHRKVTPHFEIFYEKGVFMNSASIAAEKEYTKIVTTFGFARMKITSRIKMYLFSDPESWKEFLTTNRDRTVHWAAGFAVAEANEIYLHGTESKKDLLKGVLPHELTHILHQNFVGRTVFQPLWFTEGLARVTEEDAIKDARRWVRRVVKTDSFIDVKTLTGYEDYPSDMERIQLFYDESALLVAFLLDKYGQETLRTTMFALARPRPFAEIAERILHTDVASLEKAWQAWIR